MLKSKILAITTLVLSILFAGGVVYAQVTSPSPSVSPTATPTVTPSASPSGSPVVVPSAAPATGRG